MIRLLTFGSVGLEGLDGRAIAPVLAQPKRLALLIYLTAARPGESHRRDHLLPLFWPDLDDARARDALNQALRFLRQALGPETFARQSADAIGIEPGRIWCDAVGFQDALDAGRPEEALDLYRGDFLQGFFIEDAAGFEEWMERERTAFRDAAAKGARRLAERHEGAGELTLAISWGQKVLDLTPDDERGLRRLLRLHAHAGDRVGALRLYEAFARRLQREYDCPPSPETVALMEELRSGDTGPGGDQPAPRKAPVPSPSARQSEAPAEVPDAPLATPEALESLSKRYRIERRLGAGGMATVYLARDLKHDREVALKVLRPDIAEGLARERFLREIRIAGRLNHPNIVPLFDSGEDGGRLYYVMPYVQGETLRERLRREGRFAFADVVHLLHEVGAALAYAHERGVLHRDIKPENILLLDRRAVLSDFGIARAAHAARPEGSTVEQTLTQQGTSLGTPAYMAPEQVAGSAQVDYRADLYATGVLGYELLTGRPPFTGATPQEILAAQVLESPTPVTDLRPDTPPQLADLVMQCLQKDPDRRPESAPVLMAMLERVGLQGEQLPALIRRGLLTPFRRVRAFSRKRRRAVWAGLIGVALVLSALAFRGVTRADTIPGSTVAELSRIAVLYFDDASPDGRLRWLARGLTEELIDGLAAVGGLTVISRNGVRPYEGRTEPVEAIGRALDVGLLIDGTVEAVAGAADSVRLSVRLVEAKTGIQLARETLTRQQAEPAALRDDLAELVEVSLRREIGARVRLRRERQSAGSDRAWELVRRARALRDESRELEWPAAGPRFRQADSLLAVAENLGHWVEPTIERAALALHWGVALDAHRQMNHARSRSSTDSLAAIVETGLAHATRALRVAPTEARAFDIRGELGLSSWIWQASSKHPQDSVLAAAKTDLLKAVTIDPGLARAWYALTNLYLVLGNPDESALAARKALAADVFADNAASVATGLFTTALSQGNRSLADSTCAFGRLHFPRNPNFQECEFNILTWLGTTRADVAAAGQRLLALDTIARIRQTRFQRRLLWAALLARAGQVESSRVVYDQTLADAKSEGSTAKLVQYEAYLQLLYGNRKGALDLLGSVVAEDSSRRASLRVHPWFRSLGPDPDFQRVVGRAQ